MADDLPSDALFRIRSQRTGDFLHASRGTDVSVSPHFFSLFELRPLVDGEHALQEHWSSRLLQIGTPGYAKRLGLAPSARPKRRYLHWYVNWPPGAPPPPPPPMPLPPVLPNQRFHLQRRPGGGHVLLARGRGGREPSAVRQSSQGPWLVISGGAGSPSRGASPSSPAGEYVQS